jgi:hypothetical protein
MPRSFGITGTEGWPGQLRSPSDKQRDTPARDFGVPHSRGRASSARYHQSGRANQDGFWARKLCRSIHDIDYTNNDEHARANCKTLFTGSNPVVASKPSDIVSRVKIRCLRVFVRSGRVSATESNGCGQWRFE